jgi:hypothetical protein
MTSPTADLFERFAGLLAPVRREAAGPSRLPSSLFDLSGPSLRRLRRDVPLRLDEDLERWDGLS